MTKEPIAFAISGMQIIAMASAQNVHQAHNRISNKVNASVPLDKDSFHPLLPARHVLQTPILHQMA
jgi:hypothetical protein